MMATLRLEMKLLIAAAAVLVLSGCSKDTSGMVVPETRHVVFDRPAPIPPGAVRFCWEEPMVQYEPNGPGLDVEGRWYAPSYIAVRKVKDGRWRPCQPVLSEIKGETKNER
ncbi:MAG TPA: hypothetical protein PLP17_02355 [Oligoflexia bacterium]|nr:hypothetical protein [Oligoflexia bacterium]